MRGWTINLTTLSLLSGCAVSPGNGTSHLLSINYSLLRRPAVVYEQFEHRPPHRDRVEYFRWLHGAPIDPYDVTAMMSTPARTEWQVGPDPSPNGAGESTSFMAPPTGGHTVPGSMPPPLQALSPVAPTYPMDEPRPAPTVPPVPENNSWLQLFPDAAKPSTQSPTIPSPPTPENPVRSSNPPLFPDTIPPLEPKASSTDGNVTQAVHQTAHPVSHPATTHVAPQTATAQPSRVSSRILFPSR